MCIPLREGKNGKIRQEAFDLERDSRKRVYLWGAGKNSDRAYACLDKTTCIFSGIVDKKYQNMGTFHGCLIESPDVLKYQPFDVLLITPQKWESIAEEYRSLGLPEDKRICFCQEGCTDADIFDQQAVRYVRRCVFLEREVRKWRNRALNAPYEYAPEPPVRIHDGLELLDRILRERCSVSRFGDGEYSTMLGERRYVWFQSGDEELGKRLQEVLNRRDPKLVLTLQNSLWRLDRHKEWVADIWRDYYVTDDRRHRILALLDPNYDYYDTNVTRPYITYRDPHHGDEFFRLWKKVFAGRDILLVEGEKSRFGIGSDLLESAQSVRRILAPAKNAYSVYSPLLEAVKRHAKPGNLVLISLGPTATVLAADVHDMGVQAIDIGQLDNEYDWCRMGAEHQVPIPGKMVAEALPDEVKGACDDSGFFNQVVEVVKRM